MLKVRTFSTWLVKFETEYDYFACLQIGEAYLERTGEVINDTGGVANSDMANERNESGD